MWKVLTRLQNLREPEKMSLVPIFEGNRLRGRMQVERMGLCSVWNVLAAYHRCFCSVFVPRGQEKCQEGKAEKGTAKPILA